MSNGPSPEPKSSQPHQRRRIWKATGLTLGAIATLGIAGGAWWVWMFVNEELAPWASDYLTNALDRPVTLGAVERVSLTGVRFGPSVMPATATDPDELFVESIAVRINPLNLLRRQLNPHIQLSGVQAYIVQDAQGNWVDVELDLDEDDDDGDPFVRVNPTVSFDTSEVVLVPYIDDEAAPQTFTISDIVGTVSVDEIQVENPREGVNTTIDAQEIALEISARPQATGNLEFEGVIRQLDYGENAPDNLLDSLEAQIVLRAQAIDFATLAPIVVATTPGSVPIAVTAGRFSGNLELELEPFETPQVTGTASLENGELFITGDDVPFSDINTQARFQGDRVLLEDTTATYGAFSAAASGTIDLQDGYNLTGTINPVTLAGIAATFDFEYPVEMAGTLKASDVRLTGPLNKPTITGLVATTETATIDRVEFAQASSQVTYGPGEFTFRDFQAELLAGGRLSGNGELDFGRPPVIDFELAGRNLPADAIAQLYGLPADLSIGTLTLDANIVGPINDLNGVVSWSAPGGTYPTRGTAEVTASTVRLRNAEIAGGTVAGVAQFAQSQWTADVQAQGLQLGAFNRELRGVTAGGNVQLAGRTDDFSLAGIRGTGEVAAALQGGSLDSQFTLAQGNWNADVQTRNLLVQQFAPNARIGNLTADARLSGRVDDFSLAGIRGTGVATLTIAGGTVTGDFTVASGAWQVAGRADNVILQEIARDLRGTAAGTFQLAGRFDDLTPGGMRGRANLRLSDGLATGRVLNPVLGRSRAPLDAAVAWDGRILRIDSLETGGLVASGTVTPRLTGPGGFGIAALDLGLSAQNYDVAALPIALPPAIALQGVANLQGRLTGPPNNLTFAGDLALTNLAVNDLDFEQRLAGTVAYSNQGGLIVDLIGQNDQILVDYAPQARQLNATIRAGEAIARATTVGDLLQTQLYNFPVSVLNIPAEESAYGSLRGFIEFASASINLNNFNTVGQVDIQGLGFGFFSVDRLYGGFRYADGVARLDAGQIIMADRNQRGEIIATRAYDLTGRYSFNQEPQLVATLTADQGELRDLFEVLKIQELADFGRGFTPNEGFIPESTAEAQAILATNPVGNPNASLLNQLRRLAEILELQILQEIAAEDATLPPLSELQGSFSGRVDLTATLPEDLRVAYDLTGANWEWGPNISADTMVAQGSYQNGLLTFAPLQFSSDLEGEIASATAIGSFSLDPADTTERQMVLQVVNVPISDLEEFANLPFDLDGRVNSVSTLSGRLGDPNLVGELEVVNGTLNGAAIAATNAAYSYIDARAGLDARLLLAGSSNPLTLSAQVPYRLGFVDVEPVDQTYTLQANVEDEGLALLNLFTQQLAWESGEGQVLLDIEGDLSVNNGLPTTFRGLIEFEDATISASALPAPMTDVTGRIRLLPQAQAIVVEELTGQFSEGQLSARGAFPLFLPLEQTPETTAAEEPAAVPDAADETAETPASAAPGDAPATPPPLPQNQPLTINLDNIALNLQGLYNGQVNGEMQLLGSLLLGPELTGEIDLADGTITVPEGGDPATVSSPETIASDRTFPPFSFENLRIFLARNINFVQGNFLNVTAQGGLRLDGTLATLRPTGTIQLPRGRIGLFAVALRLAGDRDRAEFRGSFDPILDVTLQTALPEVSPTTFDPVLTTSPFPQNEISDNTLANIGLTQQGNRLVRITARYTGPASELANLATDSRNLEFSSSPPRTDAEIITLLSGNVIGAINTLGSDNALTGIGTLVGSALLNSIRDFLGDTVPISEVRLFQVVDSDDVGGEIGFEISPTISVSVLKVLTNDTPFQFSTRYRLSDEFTLRGTTSYEDFSERTGVLLEYETRF